MTGSMEVAEVRARAQRILGSDWVPRVVVGLAVSLPGVIAAISCGGLSASVTHLLPIVLGTQPGNDA
jgi:hypothetical protein